MIYEYHCIRCGKHVRKDVNRRYTPKYCGPECCREAQREMQRERDRTLRESRTPIQARPLVPYRICKKCRWGRIHNKDNMSCTYLEHHDHTRTSLHPEGLTADCKEFEPKRRKKHGKSENE